MARARGSDEIDRNGFRRHGGFCFEAEDLFDADFGVDEWHGTNAFFRDGDRIFRTYFVNNRGDEALGSTWSYLDLTALGRQEEWEDSPDGYPQTPAYEWWNPNSLRRYGLAS